jgi:hypothetical protein
LVGAENNRGAWEDNKLDYVIMSVTDRDGKLAAKGASLTSAVNVPTCEACMRDELAKAHSGVHTANNQLESLVAAAQRAAQVPRTFTISTPNTMRSQVTVSCSCGRSPQLAQFYTDVSAPVQLAFEASEDGADAFTKVRKRGGGVGRFAQRLRYMLASSRCCIEEHYRILGMCGVGCFDSRRLQSQSSEVAAGALQRILGERCMSRLLRHTTVMRAPRMLEWGAMPDIELGTSGPLVRDIIEGKWDNLSRENQQLCQVLGVIENWRRHDLTNLRIRQDKESGAWIVYSVGPVRFSIVARYVAAVDGSWSAGNESNAGQVGTVLLPPDMLTAATSYALQTEVGEPYIAPTAAPAAADVPAAAPADAPAAAPANAPAAAPAAAPADLLAAAPDAAPAAGVVPAHAAMPQASASAAPADRSKAAQGSGRKRARGTTGAPADTSAGCHGSKRQRTAADAPADQAAPAAAPARVAVAPSSGNRRTAQAAAAAATAAPHATAAPDAVGPTRPAAAAGTEPADAAVPLVLPAVPDYLRPVASTQFSNGRVVGSAQHPLIAAPMFQRIGAAQNTACTNKEFEGQGFLANVILAALLGRNPAVQCGDGDGGLKIILVKHAFPERWLPILRLDINHGCKGITKVYIVDGGLKKLLGCVLFSLDPPFPCMSRCMEHKPSL